MRKFHVNCSLILLLASCLLLSGANRLVAATTSETLEKAIYTEETLGKLEDAIKLYEQVIAEAAAVRGLAAQAQYRLALIYEKQGKQTAATAAFEKLIKEYPTETKFVAKARAKLPSAIKLEPAPWKDHEAMQLNFKLPNGFNVGTNLYRIDSETFDGKECWRCKARVFVTIGAGNSYSTALVEKESFAPIRSRWDQQLLGVADAVYNPNTVELKNRNGGSAREIPIDGPVFDNEEVTQLIRRLPLAIGYSVTLKVFSSLTGTIVPLECKVVGKDTVETPAGKFECFKLQMPIVHQTFYFSADEHRYLVKFEAGGVIAELAKVFTMEPGKSTIFDSGSITCDLPIDWFTYATPATGEFPPIVYLLNTNDKIVSEILVRPRKEIKNLDSITAWRDAAIEEYRKTHTDLQIRKGSQVDAKIADSPAASFVVDFKEGDKKLAMYETKIFGDQTAVTIRVRLPVDQLDAYRKQLDQVVKSTQWK
jgi:hypothetical protein